MADLATAYVRIIPSLKGAGKTIKSELDGVDTTPSGKKVGGKFTDGLKSGISTAKVAIGNIIADLAMSAATAAASAIKNIVGGAFNNYADYEQFVGGIEKLYGDSAQKMMQYADTAYMTMGKSKNEYMEQVTSFSAALISDLGGDTSAAADQANRAMTEIADNVSIFGSNVEDVQNAFQGFAKQNYTMLDNLKLGYGGTKEEMQRLIADANEYAASIGQASDLSIDSFSDIVTAIDLIQQKQGIAGNAASESLRTLSGSIAATKAAYDNLLTTLGDPNGNISLAVTNLVDMVSNSAQLIIPKITEIMSNLAIAIPQLVDQLLPVLSEHSTELINSLSEVIAALVPVLLEAAVILFAAILAALVKSIPQILENMGTLILNLVSAIANGIDPAMQEMNNFMQGILDTIGGFFMGLFHAGEQLVQEIKDGAADTAKNMGDFFGGFIQNALNAVLSFFGGMLGAGIQLVQGIISGASQIGGTIADYFTQWIQAAVSYVENFFWSMYNAGVNIVQGLINGIAYNIGAVIDTLVGGIQNAVNQAMAFLGIASPSKLFAGIGEYTMQGFAKGIDSAAGEAESAMQKAMSDVYGAADGVASVSMKAEATGSGSMATEVASLREELRQMRLVLNIDGRAFAEATVGEIDRALGTSSRRAMAR